MGKVVPGIGEAAGTPLRNDERERDGSKVDAGSLNNPMFEMENVIKMLLGEGSPKALDPLTMKNGDQIARGLKAALIGLQYQEEASDSTSNHYILQYPAELNQILQGEVLSVIKAYTNGLKVIFKVVHENSGNSTLSAYGLSSKPIRKKGGIEELEIGDFKEGSIVELIFVKGEDDSTGYWEVLKNSGEALNDEILNKLNRDLSNITQTGKNNIMSNIMGTNYSQKSAALYSGSLPKSAYTCPSSGLIIGTLYCISGGNGYYAYVKINNVKVVGVGGSSTAHSNNAFTIPVSQGDVFSITQDTSGGTWRGDAYFFPLKGV